MKYFAALFLAFSVFFRSHQLLASEEIEHLTYKWSGDEENLYININLSKDVVFTVDYTTMKTTDGQGQGCELICKPIQANTIFSSEGYELQEIKLLVVLNNIENPNKAVYTTTITNFYKGISDKGFPVSSTSESKRKAVLNNPAIDLTQEPVFFTIKDGLHNGVISFKNAFPYSQIP